MWEVAASADRRISTRSTLIAEPGESDLPHADMLRPANGVQICHFEVNTEVLRTWEDGLHRVDAFVGAICPNGHESDRAGPNRFGGARSSEQAGQD
jgi:hypothetical protein